MGNTNTNESGEDNAERSDLSSTVAKSFANNATKTNNNITGISDFELTEIFNEMTFPVTLKYAESDVKFNEISLDFVPISNIIPSIWDLFTNEKVLGSGASCSVILVSERRKRIKPDFQPPVQFALKQIVRANNENREMFAQEVHIMKKLQENSIHTNVVRFVDCYIDDYFYYILLEYGSGGTMLQRILNSDHFSERDAAKWIKTILDGVQYFHSLNIVHRDLKADNFIFDSMEENANLKIIDFGNSHQIDDDEEDNMAIGGKHYFPPETFRKRKGWELRKGTFSVFIHNNCCFVLFSGDMWMIGICCYILLCGTYPFYGQTDQELYDNICMAELPWPRKNHLSHTCKDFIRRLLCLDVKRRLSASEALIHPWITGSASNKHLGKDYMHQLKIFAHSNPLEHILVGRMLSSMSTIELQDFPTILKDLNIEKGGKLDFADVVHYMLVNSELKNSKTLQLSLKEGTMLAVISESIDIAALLEEIDVDLVAGVESVQSYKMPILQKLKMTEKSMELLKFEERVDHTPKINVKTLENILRKTEQSEAAIHDIVAELEPTDSNRIYIQNIHSFVDKNKVFI